MEMSEQLVECSKLLPAACFDPIGGPGFHNAYVGFILMITLSWLIYRLYQVIQFYEMIRIIEEDGKVIYLSSLGPYSHDLKRLMKIHISQIIRERCSISAVPLNKISVLSAIDETTIKTKLIPNSSSSSNPDESYSLEISFKVDSDLPYTVQLFWGVEYNTTKNLIYNFNKEEMELTKEEKNFELRRMAIGSSSAMLNQIKEKHEQKYFQDDDEQEKDDLRRADSEDFDLSLPIDFSPRNSIMTLAQVNPILYTSILNRNDEHHSNNSFTRNYTNWSLRGNVIQFIRNKFGNNFSTSNSNDTFYSRWNNSVLGGHGALLSKILKKVINRFLYRINNINETTTESLLEISAQISNEKNNFRKPTITKNNIFEQYENKAFNIFKQLNPFYTSPIKFYNKGLSQEYNDRIKLTPEYVNHCNLLSPYYNYESDNDYCYDERSNPNDACLMSYDINENKELGITRIPLLIVIKSNLQELDESIISKISNYDNFKESLTFCNTVLLHFQLIQDHYNTPYLMYKPILLKQTFSNIYGSLIEPYDTYGLEDDELDCLICMSNPKDVVLLPCRHCISCEFCLRSLRQDKCPLCRTTFYGFVVLPIKNT